MEVIKTNTVEINYTLEDLAQQLVKNGKNIKVEPIYRVDTIPGYDPHDCDYVNVFAGIKIKYEE
jgi:hypothetical protein